MTTAPVCHAPFTTLHLDPHGRARVCCENRLYVVGDATTTDLLDIWRGPTLGRLREAMTRHDLALGCEGCATGIVDGERWTVRAGMYDHLAPSDTALPTRLELELSNTCNLQCVMCNGELSSSIRAQREHRPPLPGAYGDAFFAQLAELAPHLREVLFLGGEPFLARESLRAMEVLRDHGFTGRCHVTTNGTVVGPRVEALLDALTIDVSISIDGATAPTVESIRVGVDYARLLDHVAWFREAADRRGTILAFHYCLMPSNWSELYPFLRWADGLGVRTTVLDVTHPISMDVCQLPHPELATVVGAMAAQATDDPGPGLSLNANVWNHQLARLRAALDRGASTPVKLEATAGPVELGHAERLGRARAELADWSGAPVIAVSVDEGGIVAGVDGDATALLGGAAGWVGRHHHDLLGALSAQLGDLARTDVVDRGDGAEERQLRFTSASGRTVDVRVRLEAATADRPATWLLTGRRVEDPAA